MSEYIKLRKMTFLSSFQEGKYAGVPIKNILDLKHTRYLRHCYYSMSNITFIPEILEILGITKEWEIEKPGTNIDIGNALDLYKYSIMSRNTRLALYQKEKKKNKNIYTKTLDKTSKLKLQAKNHGH